MNHIHTLLLTLLLVIASPFLLAQQDEDEFLVEDEDDFFFFDEEEEPTPSIADPMEGVNRAIFNFNDLLYRKALKPVARGLRTVPEPARVSASNFFNNLGTPVSAVTALLQGDLPNAGTEASRFLINTTLGILGLFDPATDMNLQRDQEDFGQTLGRWGAGHGFYIVIPFLGSSSLRDLVGRSVNASLNPVNYALHRDAIIGMNLVNVEVSLSLDKDTYESLYESALDPYIFFRSAYEQNRAGRVDQ